LQKTDDFCLYKEKQNSKKNIKKNKFKRKKYIKKNKFQKYQNVTHISNHFIPFCCKYVFSNQIFLFKKKSFYLKRFHATPVIHIFTQPTEKEE
jgi:hypothetical protein